MTSLSRILREPLLHFLLLGAALFLGYSLISRSDGGNAPRRIILSSGQLEHLATGFTRTWQRPPTDAELKGLIDDWVREEIATREAIALGLDKDDTVIRRRLRQKLEFVSEDIAARHEPTDAELNAYLHAHPKAFIIEPRITFSQVYLNPARHGPHLAGDTARMLARLQRSGSGRNSDDSLLGDPFLLERTFQSVPLSEIARQFGEKFATALSQLAPGEWSGPIESGYGVHLVLVRERTAERLPELVDVREQVVREWADAWRVEEDKRFYQDLLKRYTVIVQPGPVPGQKNTVAR
jgi:hypothetical protein